jgi:hypothetical protein
MTERPRRLIGAAVSAAALAAIVVGLYVVGSPAEARLRRLDERRVEDLRRARYSVHRYWTRHGQLPSSLDSLSQGSEEALYRDPATGRAYAYRTTSDTSYELCAVFARPASEGWQRARDEDWRHPAGEKCFPLVAPGIPPVP